MSDLKYARMPDGDRWPEFVREVERLANTPEHGYRALLIVGMRVTDGVVRLNGGASPPALRQTDGEPLTADQLHAWRNAMLASAADSLDRVVNSILEARTLRESGAAAIGRRELAEECGDGDHDQRGAAARRHGAGARSRRHEVGGDAHSGLGAV